MHLHRTPWLACLLASACADVRSPDAEPTAGAETTAATGSDGGHGEADSASVLDVGVSTTGNIDPDSQSGCDKVDFLFVVDNSGSMADEQQALIDSFGPFVAAIEQEVGASHDFHVMVVDVDAWVFGECPDACDRAETCDAGGNCGVTDECLFPCALRDVCNDGGFQCHQSEPEACEDVMGAGVHHPRGVGASNVDCAFANGGNYMDANEPDLAAAFACAARVGTGSSADTEQPMDAMVDALGYSAEAAACNAGFLRDDAILVVTFITDENDEPDDSTGSPQGWFQAVKDAKHGDDSAVVVLGLIGDNDQPNGICSPLSIDFATGAEPAPRLREFVGMWGERGHVGSVCAPDYGPFFTDAVASIAQACDSFVPPA
jgi:hypothetical protein